MTTDTDTNLAGANEPASQAAAEGGAVGDVAAPGRLSAPAMGTADEALGTADEQAGAVRSPVGPGARVGDADVLPRRGRRSVLVTVVVAAMVLGGFVALLVGAKQPNSRSTVVGRPAPSADKTFETISSTDRVGLSDYRGRYVVLNFFASWCVPCEVEHPELVRFQQRHAALGDATVVQILYNDKPGPARQFFRERGEGGWPTLIDKEGQFALDYGVTGPPETFLIDPQGFVLAGVKGAISEARLEDLLTRAKAGRP